jgi:hypothetical protein
MNINLWDFDETEIVDLGIYMPGWIRFDLTVYDMAAILQGGCASGAYMPAVTYCDAKEVMAAWGEDVIQYIGDRAPKEDSDAKSWGALCCHYLSLAVELWCLDHEYEVKQALRSLREEEEREYGAA